MGLALKGVCPFVTPPSTTPLGVFGKLIPLFLPRLSSSSIIILLMSLPVRGITLTIG